MPKKVQPIPAGYCTVTPMLSVKDAARAIEFYEKGLGGKNKGSMMMPDGKSIAHAEVVIGDSTVMVSDQMPGAPVSDTGPISFYVYVKDVDAAFKQAIKAGGKVKSAPENMFWGDRVGQLVDPVGITWWLATQVEKLSGAAMEKRMKEMMAKMAAKK